jgi:hypothetical protein
MHFVFADEVTDVLQAALIPDDGSLLEVVPQTDDASLDET